MKWIIAALTGLSTYALCAPFAFMERGYFALGGEFLLTFAAAFIVLFAMSKRKHN